MICNMISESLYDIIYDIIYTYDIMILLVISYMISYHDIPGGSTPPSIAPAAAGPPCDAKTCSVFENINQKKKYCFLLEEIVQGLEPWSSQKD